MFPTRFLLLLQLKQREKSESSHSHHCQITANDRLKKPLRLYLGTFRNSTMEGHLHHSSPSVSGAMRYARKSHTMTSATRNRLSSDSAVASAFLYRLLFSACITATHGSRAGHLSGRRWGLSRAISRHRWTSRWLR